MISLKFLKKTKYSQNALKEMFLMNIIMLQKMMEALIKFIVHFGELESKFTWIVSQTNH